MDDQHRREYGTNPWDSQAKTGKRGNGDGFSFERTGVVGSNPADRLQKRVYA